MKYSLVISTVGRTEDLRRMLTSLEAQSVRDFEVLVVDQSDGDAIARVVREFSERLTIQRLPMTQRGLSRGRNLGWAHARGEILNFPDDDCTWPPDLLARVDAILDGRPDLTALTTRVETVSRCDVDGGPVNRRNLFGRAVEFTMFLRRDVVGDLRYDEQMGVGAGTPWGADEGPDLMLRMLARGLTIEYFPDICIYHPDPALQPAERLLSRTMSYSRGRGYLYRKHGYSWL
ncbi:MAG: glycosyltransferase family 2 protein, partial [Pirellulaceae bacterium]|nr:glycosyltransferase family 2 protein [Pirellulaceae bacterium]